MLVKGNATFFGKWTSNFVGFLQGTDNSTATAVPTWVYVNDDYASLNGNRLVLKEAGQYKCTYRLLKCGYNSYSGSAVGTLYHNSTTYGTSASPVTITASAGDEIRLRFQTSGSGGARAFWTLIVEKVA